VSFILIDTRHAPSPLILRLEQELPKEEKSRKSQEEPICSNNKDAGPIQFPQFTVHFVSGQWHHCRQNDDPSKRCPKHHEQTAKSRRCLCRCPSPCKRTPIDRETAKKNATPAYAATQYGPKIQHTRSNRLTTALSTKFTIHRPTVRD